MNLTAITLMMGNTVPMLAMTGASYMVMQCFNEKNTVSKIRALPDGRVAMTV